MLYIFDKDGTLVGSSVAGRPPNTLSEQEVLPNVVETLAKLRAAGHTLSIATNQGGVAWGFISKTTAYRLAHDAARKVGGVDSVAVCCYYRWAQGKRVRPGYAKPSQHRKPNPGMLLDLMERLGFPLPVQSWWVIEFLMGKRLPLRVVSSVGQRHFLDGR